MRGIRVKETEWVRLGMAHVQGRAKKVSFKFCYGSIGSELVRAEVRSSLALSFKRACYHHPERKEE